MSEKDEQGLIQDRILRAKDQMQAMIDLNPACMLMLHDARKVVRANRACLELLGAGAFADVLGKPVDALFGLEGVQGLSAVLGEGESLSSCVVETAIKGATRSLQFSRVGRDEDFNSVFLVVEDITEKLEEDVALEQAHKITAVRQLLGSMMHHLNQPLTVIMLRANMLASAINRGRSSEQQILEGLEEISEMSMKVAGLLSKFDSCDIFEIQNYIRGIDIMKIDED